MTTTTSDMSPARNSAKTRLDEDEHDWEVTA
jgi:hypothetical protein